MASKSRKYEHVEKGSKNDPELRPFYFHRNLAWEDCRAQGSIFFNNQIKTFFIQSFEIDFKVVRMASGEHSIQFRCDTFAMLPRQNINRQLDIGLRSVDVWFVVS